MTEDGRYFVQRTPQTPTDVSIPYRMVMRSPCAGAAVAW